MLYSSPVIPELYCLETIKRRYNELISSFSFNRNSPPATTAPEAETEAEPELTGAEQSTVTDYSAIQQEKARLLFAKYGLTLDPGEWKSPTDLQFPRVTKTIRMRVRRTCHRCETTFGSDKLCVNCQHQRCKKCPRFPPTHEAGDDEYPRVPR
jgi:hypothetical protein